MQRKPKALHSRQMPLSLKYVSRKWVGGEGEINLPSSRESFHKFTTTLIHQLTRPENSSNTNVIPQRMLVSVTVVPFSSCSSCGSIPGKEEKRKREKVGATESPYPTFSPPLCASNCYATALELPLTHCSLPLPLRLPVCLPLLPFPQEIPGETCHDITESSRINTKPKLLSPHLRLAMSLSYITRYGSPRGFIFYDLREERGKVVRQVIGLRH